jgi:S1-C subfamily serine protease
LNVYGEVIGINTAIVSAGQGIGFAIPVNMAKQVAAQLIKKGAVTRGWLGVSIQPVTEDIAKSFGLSRPQGALISEIMAGGPAEKAGMKQGDIIMRFAGKEVRDARQLQLVVADTRVGEKVEVEIFREGRAQKLFVTIGNTENASSYRPRSAEPETAWFGLTVEELPADMRLSGGKGVMVTAVDPESTAAESGIQRSDIIISVNQKKVAGLADYSRAMKEADLKGSAVLLVKRGDANIYFALRIR